MNKILVAAFLLLGLTVNAQTNSSDNQEKSSLTVGFELDVFPYLSSGWYASAWVGIPTHNLRIRPIVAASNIPKFMLNRDISNNSLKVYALVVDYFFCKNFEGFWLGTGFEYWDGNATSISGIKGSYSQWVYTLGGGYVWKVWGNLYLNPWIAGHLSMSEDARIRLGGTSFKPTRFTPEVSLKLGWSF